MKLAQRLCLSARNDYLFRTASYELANYIQIFDNDYSKLRLTLDNIKDYLYFMNNDKILKNIATKKNMRLFLNKL